MNYDKMLDQAIAFSTNAHKNQQDKNQADYITHPYRVMEKMKTTKEKIVAILHDVLEDCPEKKVELQNLITDKEIWEALLAITREKDEEYLRDYIPKVKKNLLARKIKLVDLKDNLREGCPISLVARYRNALMILLDQPDVNSIQSFLEKENPHLFDFKKMHNILEKEDFPISRFLRFKCKDISSSFDPDKSILTMSIMCILLKYHGMEVLGYEDRYIYVWDKDRLIEMETDTINSFTSLYKGALMRTIPNYVDMCNKCEVNGSFSQNFPSIYKAYKNGSGFALQKSSGLKSLFEEFAEKTHTIGDFTVGPLGFNYADKKAKAKLVSCGDWENFDRMDVFLGHVINGDTHAEWEQFYSKWLCASYSEFFVEMSSVVMMEKGLVDVSKLQVIPFETELRKRLEQINKLIEDRGVKMVEDLRDAMRKGIR